jgi:hypothetical protein
VLGCGDSGGSQGAPLSIDDDNLRAGDRVDLDGDGRADGTALDGDGDGRADGVDLDGDGVADLPVPQPGGPAGTTGGASSDGSGTEATRDAGPLDDGSKKVVRMTSAVLVIHETSRLTIGTTLPEFAYAGGENQGTLTEYDDGTAEVFFPASMNSVTPLEVIPGGLGQVNIEPNDMTGQIDFCTGIMTMPFDAKFTPEILGTKQKEMSVVTDLTTETSMGDVYTLMGIRLSRAGDLKLVGVARVPKTDDVLVDGLLGLPTDAATNMDGTLSVTGGFPACPEGRVDERK